MKRGWQRLWRAVTIVAAGAAATGCQATEKINVYQFEQTVTRTERDDPGSDPATENYRRAGFLVFDPNAAGPAALALTFAEYGVAETLAAVTKPGWARADLAAADGELRSRRSLEWGWPSSPTEVLFDETGGEPAVAGAPLPFSAIHLPGVLSAVPTGAGAAGAAEKVVHITWGAAVFSLPYRVVADDAAGWARLQLGETPVVFRGRMQLLVLKAAGGWRVKAGNAPLRPDELVGKYSLRLLVRRGAGEAAVESELSATELEFRTVRLPQARLDGEQFTPGPLRPPGG